MTLSVEPLCPTHNAQRRREPVYNSDNPHHKTRTVMFQLGDYYFKHVPNSCNHFARAETQHAFPPCTVACILFFQKPQRYYSLVWNLYNPDQCYKITTNFFVKQKFFGLFFICWSIHNRQSPSHLADQSSHLLKGHTLR